MDQSVIDEALRFKINFQKEYVKVVGERVMSSKELIKNINVFLAEIKQEDCKIKIVIETSDEGYEMQTICAVATIDKTENELKIEIEAQKKRCWNVLKAMQEMFEM